jgi:hypothetical protein
MNQPVENTTIVNVNERKAEMPQMNLVQLNDVSMLVSDDGLSSSEQGFVQLISGEIRLLTKQIKIVVAAEKGQDRKLLGQELSIKSVVTWEWRMLITLANCREHEHRPTSLTVAVKNALKSSSKRTGKQYLISSGHWDHGNSRLASFCHRHRM